MAAKARRRGKIAVIEPRSRKAGAMARITVEDCLAKVDNRFGIIHLAAQRVRQLNRGSRRTVSCKNENVVAALREIAAGQVTMEGRKQKTGKN